MAATRDGRVRGPRGWCCARLQQRPSVTGRRAGWASEGSALSLHLAGPRRAILALPFLSRHHVDLPLPPRPVALTPPRQCAPELVRAGSERSPRLHPGVAGGKPDTGHAGRIHTAETVANCTSGLRPARKPSQSACAPARTADGSAHPKPLLGQPRNRNARPLSTRARACSPGTLLQTPGELRRAQRQTRPAPAAGTSGLTFHISTGRPGLGLGSGLDTQGRPEGHGRISRPGVAWG